MSSQKRWCIWYTPFRSAPNGSQVMQLPLGSIVETTGNQQTVVVSGQETLWSEVIYKDQRAWVYDPYLEEYEEKFADHEVVIANPTPDPNDAAQYMLVEGNVKRNMCGELCVAYLMKEDIETFLAKWKVASPGYYKWKLFGANDNPTRADGLDDMLKMYGYPAPNLRFDMGVKDPIIGIKVSPGRIKKMLETYWLIAGVRIDKISGRLRGQGIGHWVVVDSVTPNDVNSGWVVVYNPFRNKKQEYSYDEFINAMGIPRNGIWVKKK